MAIRFPETARTSDEKAAYLHRMKRLLIEKQNAQVETLSQGDLHAWERRHFWPLHDEIMRELHALYSSDSGLKNRVDKDAAYSDVRWDSSIDLERERTALAEGR